MPSRNLTLYNTSSRQSDWLLFKMCHGVAGTSGLVTAGGSAARFCACPVYASTVLMPNRLLPGLKWIPHRQMPKLTPKYFPLLTQNQCFIAGSFKAANRPRSGQVPRWLAVRAWFLKGIQTLKHPYSLTTLKMDFFFLGGSVSVKAARPFMPFASIGTDYAAECFGRCCSLIGRDLLPSVGFWPVWTMVHTSVFILFNKEFSQLQDHTDLDLACTSNIPGLIR